jgi:signal transduction histidine kinase
VLVFLVLALASRHLHWRRAEGALGGLARGRAPAAVDYVDRLAQEVGSPPSIARAQALVQRLPVTIRIEGPQVNWASHPELPRPAWVNGSTGREPPWRNGDDQNLLRRTTADGHRLEFGLHVLGWEQRPRIAWVTLGALLLLTALAYLYVRRLLRPLDDIRAGAQRFGAGAFDQPIPVRHAHRPDELGQLAATINTMGEDIHQMLEAKRALLLAMSHELRSPLTRARLNAELLPETAEVDPSARPCCATWARWRASSPTCWKASAWPPPTPRCIASPWTWWSWRAR